MYSVDQTMVNVLLPSCPLRSGFQPSLPVSPPALRTQPLPRSCSPHCDWPLPRCPKHLPLHGPHQWATTSPSCSCRSLRPGLQPRPHPCFTSTHSGSWGLPGLTGPASSHALLPLAPCSPRGLCTCSFPAWNTGPSPAPLSSHENSVPLTGSPS